MNFNLKFSDSGLKLSGINWMVERVPILLCSRVWSDVTVGKAA